MGIGVGAGVTITLDATAVALKLLVESGRSDEPARMAGGVDPSGAFDRTMAA